MVSRREFLEGLGKIAAGYAAAKVLEPLEAAAKDNPWQRLDKGLDFADFQASKKSILGDSKISVLRIDLEHYALQLLTALEYNGSRTAPGWAEDFGLVAVINAGMFEPDRTSTGYMKNFVHINNSEFKKGYNSIFVFNPKRRNLPLAKIVDARCETLADAVKDYQTASQSLRMIDCHGKNTWTQQHRKWSQAAIAMDNDGNPLFVHSRSPHSVHDFIDNVLALPIDVKNMIYVEGGPEASLYVKAGKQKISRIGSYETGFNENDNNHQFWDLPNVIAVKKR